MSTSPKPISAIPPFGLRMQPALKAKVEEAAKQNARSLNAEIVERLQASFDPMASDNSTADMAALAARLQAELAEEQFKNHTLVVKLSQVAEIMEDDLHELETYASEHNLDLDDLGIDEWDWRKIISEYRYADRWLEQEAKKYEDQLKQAMEARDRSLKELRERIERRNAAVHGNAPEGSGAPSSRMKFEHTTKPDRGDK